MKAFTEGRDFKRTRQGLLLQDSRRIALPDVRLPLPDGPYMIHPDEAGTHYEVYRCDDALLILWGMMSQRNNAYYCKLKPKGVTAPSVDLDRIAIGFSPFARDPHIVRSEVSSIERITDHGAKVSLYIENGWKDTHRTNRGYSVKYALAFQTGKVKMLSCREEDRKG